LDFTAMGGKRQGREVPQSLKTTRFGKPNQSKVMDEFKKPPERICRKEAQRALIAKCC
jgi:hypothetical protein